ncbi:MAG: hypothetical protein PHE20_01760 [Patescibacteria group bacterium]|nr:hypothetical protein [Patescibacteria group bacterium]
MKIIRRIMAINIKASINHTQAGRSAFSSVTGIGSGSTGGKTITAGWVGSS